MRKQILGRKQGMTQVFGDKGIVIPVTVIEATPCTVVQIKTKEKDGYCAIVVGYEDIRKSLVNKPKQGTFKKAGTTPKRILREFRLDDCGDCATDCPYKVGDVITCDTFAAGDIVDVTARTKGHGYTGVIKRWNFKEGNASHGSGYHRGIGGLQANTFPGRVFPGRKMSGRYGNEQVTIQNLTVVRVDKERNCILLKGGVPGSCKGALVTIRSAIKKAGAK
jgi:large subunit ribosomal protein L3